VALQSLLQVMLAKNLETSAGLVNGARGVVVGFTRPQERRSLLVEASAKPVSPSGMWPVVKFASDNVERMIMPESWTIMEGDKEVAKRTQIPLLLAWALSVHKCQGMTLDRVETDLSKAFDYGMVYVALSRVKSLDGLRLIGFDPSKIKVHQKVALFYEKLKSANDINESTCTD
jgi:ATP-dependent DNA helicase PIF1